MNTTVGQANRFDEVNKPSSWPFSVIAGLSYWFVTTGFLVSSRLGPIDTLMRIVGFFALYNSLLTLVLQGFAVIIATLPPSSARKLHVGEQLLSGVVPLWLFGLVYAASLFLINRLALIGAPDWLQWSQGVLMVISCVILIDRWIGFGPIVRSVMRRKGCRTRAIQKIIYA